MERSSHDDLATALAEARPAPREGFAKELDERVAAGFPRRSRLNGSPFGPLVDRLRAASPQRLLFATGGAALAAIAIATVIVAGGGPERSGPTADQAPSGGLLSELSGSSESDAPPSESAEQKAARPPESNSASAAGASGESASAAGAVVSPPAYSVPGRPSRPSALAQRHRDIERSAEIGLLADPADVADDSAAVFAAVHDARGIVLRSTTTAGRRAGARFELLIPSARLGDALAAFSAIDEVRSRHEATEDITRPTVTTAEELRDSRARIDALLAQLAAAETEAKMEAIEAELESERRHAAQLRSQLGGLERRTDFSRVSVKIESGDSLGAGRSWGIDDAFGDAGHILGIAAGIALLALAVLTPLALICLLAWLAHRAWVHSQRRRALRNA